MQFTRTPRNTQDLTEEEIETKYENSVHKAHKHLAITGYVLIGIGLIILVLIQYIAVGGGFILLGLILELIFLRVRKSLRKRRDRRLAALNPEDDQNDETDEVPDTYYEEDGEGYYDPYGD